MNARPAQSTPLHDPRVERHAVRPNLPNRWASEHSPRDAFLAPLSLACTLLPAKQTDGSKRAGETAHESRPVTDSKPHGSFLCDATRESCSLRDSTQQSRPRRHATHRRRTLSNPAQHNRPHDQSDSGDMRMWEAAAQSGGAIADSFGRTRTTHGRSSARDSDAACRTWIWDSAFWKSRANSFRSAPAHDRSRAAGNGPLPAPADASSY